MLFVMSPPSSCDALDSCRPVTPSDVHKVPPTLPVFYLTLAGEMQVIHVLTLVLPAYTNKFISGLCQHNHPNGVDGREVHIGDAAGWGVLGL